jgi:YesN/AraC family two-component response regulator
MVCEQNRLTQQLAHHQQAHLQQQVLQLQQERQHAMQVSQQQNIQQQLQSSQLQAAQNAVQQASQVRPQIGQQGSSMSNLYGSGTHNLLTSNVMGAMSQSTPSQSLLQQRIQQVFHHTLFFSLSCELHPFRH